MTFLVAYLFFGIEEIGVTIEDPFEGQDNDLPLEEICGTIDRNLSAMIADHIVLHVDDTPVPVLAPGTGKTKTGQGIVRITIWVGGAVAR